MQKFLIETLAILIAMSAGFCIFVAIFFAPTFLYGNEIMLAWGWVGWIPALVAGKWIGTFVRKMVKSKFCINPAM
jgi:hypothetical protein